MDHGYTPYSLNLDAGKNNMNIKKILTYIVIVAGSFFLYHTANSISHPETSHLLVNFKDFNVDESQSILSQMSQAITTQPFSLYATIIFLLAVIHTFLARTFTKLSHELLAKATPEKPYYHFWGNILHFFGEVEVIFGLWIIPLVIVMALFFDWETSIHYLSERNYVEALFVVVIMAVASTKPVIDVANKGLGIIANLAGGTVSAWWWTILTFGCISGSLITEPAAMTISALLISRKFYDLEPSIALKYATLGLLFTNISVGGVFTNFAAPPVLMVSSVWNWDINYMFTSFGLKALLGIVLGNFIYFILFRKEFKKLDIIAKDISKSIKEDSTPTWIILVHVFVLAWIVIHAHYPVIFIGVFLLFLGFYKATQEYQDPLELKNAVLVGFFLASLVIHGSLQAWWIAPLLSHASFEGLFGLATFLTAFTDNAAITYLATLIPNFDHNLKYAVVAGAVTGGGLTVIANAPNLTGQSLVQKHFPEGVSALYLFLGASIPTLMVGGSFYLFRAWS